MEFTRERLIHGVAGTMGSLLLLAMIFGGMYRPSYADLDDEEPVAPPPPPPAAMDEEPSGPVVLDAGSVDEEEPAKADAGQGAAADEVESAAPDAESATVDEEEVVELDGEGESASVDEEESVEPDGEESKGSVIADNTDKKNVKSAAKKKGISVILRGIGEAIQKAVVWEEDTEEASSATEGSVDTESTEENAAETDAVGDLNPGQAKKADPDEENWLTAIYNRISRILRKDKNLEKKGIQATESQGSDARESTEGEEETVWSFNELAPDTEIDAAKKKVKSDEKEQKGAAGNNLPSWISNESTTGETSGGNGVEWTN